MVKLICFPFFNGDLLNWVPSNLSDKDRERVYKGEMVSTKWGSNELIWRTLEQETSNFNRQKAFPHQKLYTQYFCHNNQMVC